MLDERLTAAERDAKLAALNEQQRTYLMNYLQRGKRTAFDNFMQDEKVTAIRSADEIALNAEEMVAADWTIAHFIDHGENNRAGKCACGRALRYEFTVEHSITKKKIRYGKEHLSQFLNIDVRDVDVLLGTIEKFDYELDEVLTKMDRDDYGFDLYEKLLNKEDVPGAILQHIDLQLPLLDYQRRKLVKMMHAQIEEKLRAIELADAERDAKLIAEAKKYVALQQQLRAQQEAERAEKLAAFEQQQQEKNAQLTALFHEAIRTMSPEESELEQIVFALVQNGIHSAVAMSKLVAKNFAKEKRVSIGVKERPYVYFDVLLALDRQVTRGKLVKDDASNMHDCFYYVDATGGAPEMESYQQTLF